MKSEAESIRTYLISTREGGGLKSLRGVWATENEWHDEKEEYDFHMFVLETELTRELQPAASSTIFHQSRKSKN